MEFQRCWLAVGVGCALLARCLGCADFPGAFLLPRLWAASLQLPCQELGRILCARVRCALSKPCTFGGVPHFSQLSEAKIRRETGNYLVWVEFISVPAHHSSFLSLSWDIPAPILNPAEPSGNLPVVPNLEVLLLWGHFGGSSPSQGAPHRLCASVPTLKLKWGRPSAAILLFPFV